MADGRAATAGPGLLKLAADAEGEDNASLGPSHEPRCLASYHAFTGFRRALDDALADGRRTFTAPLTG